MKVEVRHGYKFGCFHLDPVERILLRDEVCVPITLKAFDILLLLIQNSMRIVTKDELMRAIWPDAFVEEANLTQHVFMLRKALGDNHSQPHYIQTVPRRGYRFIKAVTAINADHSGDVKRTKGSAIISKRHCLVGRANEIPSLAILPLINANTDKDSDYLSDVITESIINNLSQVPRLRVMASSTVSRYKGEAVTAQEVGEEINVRAVVTGSVLEFDGKLVVNVELVDAGDGSQIWGKQYYRNPNDVFRVQEDISSEIYRDLRLQIANKPAGWHIKPFTSATEANKLYLKGRYFWNKRTAESLKKGIDYFEQAIETDPNHALAYMGLADSYLLVAGYNVSPPKQAFEKAKAMAVKALEIDSTLAEAHTALAIAAVHYDWDWQGAERKYRQAINLNPNCAIVHHGYGQFLAKTGQYTQALIELKRAQELDPLSLTISTDIGRVYCYMGRYDKAIQQCVEALEMDSNFCPAHGVLARTYERKGMCEEAIAHCKKLMTFTNGDAEVVAFLGNYYAVSGDYKKAKEELERLKQLLQSGHISPFYIAVIYAGLERNDQALEYLEKAYEERSSQMSFLNVDPVFERLRSDSRFMTLLRRIGLAS